MLTSTYDASLIDYAYPTCINMLSNMTHKYALKSGSTDTDAWVIGYTNGIVLASWSGYDDNKKINSNVVPSCDPGPAPSTDMLPPDSPSIFARYPTSLLELRVVNPCSSRS